MAAALSRLSSALGGGVEQFGGVPWCAVVGVFQGDEGVSGEVFHVLMGHLDGGGGGEMLGQGGVSRSPDGGVEAAEHEGGVGAEDVLIDVRFVGDDEAEAPEEGGNGGGMGAADHPGVDHIGGHEYDGGGAEQVLALAHGHVAGDLLDGVGGESRGLGGLFPAHELVVR